MALRQREQAAPMDYRVHPAAGEIAVLRTIPTLEHENTRQREENARLREENAQLSAENRLLRALLSADAPQDPKGVARVGAW